MRSRNRNKDCSFSTLLHIPNWEQRRPTPLEGAGWMITFRRGPNQRDDPGSFSDDREVIITARSEAVALRGLDLIHAALVLQELDMETAHFKFRLAPFSDLRSSLPRDGYACSSVLPACKIACKASRSRRLTYALLKLFLSARLFSRHYMDFDLLHGAAISKYPLDHVHFAYAIVIAYAVVEELGLDVRKLGEQYAVKEGIWNPKVRVDLEARLAKAGVDSSKPQLWIVRSTPTKVGRRLKLHQSVKSGLAYGRVRDKEVNLVDAIYQANKIRSAVAAHAFCKETPSLSQFDVANVQHVA
jgi:hypothetical protein